MDHFRTLFFERNIEAQELDFGWFTYSTLVLSLDILLNKGTISMCFDIKELLMLKFLSESLIGND